MRRLLTLGAVMACAFSAARAETLLVLPFFNLSKTPNLDWVGESIAETVRESLAGQERLTLGREERQEVYRRLAIRPYAQLTRATVIRIGEELDADRVVFGGFSVAQDESTPPKASVRIAARVLDLKRLGQSPEFSVIGALDDLAVVETRLAWETLRQIAPQTTPSEQEFLKRRPAVRVDAKENYIRGLLAAGAEQKHRYFTQAARLDASFSPPAFQLGRIYFDKKDYRVAAGWLERVLEADSRYREARFLLGVCRYYLADYPGAQAAFERVARDVPLSEVFNNLGAAKARRGLAEAQGDFEKALEGDSSDPDYHFNLGLALWRSGRFQEAADRFRAVLDRNPADAMATLMLGRALKQSGPRPGDLRGDALERLKLNYEETAYRQLKAMLEKQ